MMAAFNELYKGSVNITSKKYSINLLEEKEVW
jgi:hypothetical protein